MPVSPYGGNKQGNKKNRKHSVMLCDKSGDSVSPGDDGPMPRLFKRFIEYQDQGGQNCHTADNTDQHAFCHHDTQIQPERKTHKTQRDKAGDRRDRAANDRRDRLCDGVCHSVRFADGG